MKKHLLSALIFATTFFAAQAQSKSFGVRAGYGWNNVSAPAFNGTIDFKTMMAMNFGVFGEFGINNKFSIQPEINATQKGFRLNEGVDLKLFGVDLPIGASAVTTIQYVEMPVLAKYKFGTEGGIRAYAMAGPTVGYAVNGNLETHVKVLIDIKAGTTPINLDQVGYKRWQTGGLIGAGVELPLGDNIRLTAEARYSHAFNTVYEVPIVGAKVQNRAFDLGVGLAYKF